MKSRKNIVFLGMMGSGKSSIGLLVSKKLKLNFVDVDKYIEDKLSMNISKIFKSKGEKFFREFEEKTTLDLLKKRNNVISLGGGAFLNKKIRDETLNKNISFWLKWDSEFIMERIQKNPKRPVAFSASRNELIEMMENRSKIYSKAMYTVECNNLTKNEIVKKVIEFYEAY